MSQELSVRGRRMLIAAAFACAGLVASAVYAQPVSDPSYLRLQRLAVQLDTLAQQAKEQAQVSAHHGGSTRLAERIEGFAHRSRDFREHLEDHKIAPNKLEDELKHLTDDALKVQRDVLRSHQRDAFTYGDWNAVVNVLNRIDGEYRADLGVIPGAVPTTGVVGDRAVDRAMSAPWFTPRFRSLADELDERASRAATLGAGWDEDDRVPVVRVRDEALRFDREIESLGPADARARVLQMLGEARGVQAALLDRDVSTDAQANWDRVVAILVTMRDLAPEPYQGTSGYGVVPEIVDRDSGAPDPLALTRELDDRSAAAAVLARQSGMEDQTSAVNRFRDRLHSFNDHYPSLSPEERREAADRLLRDAQRIERDLANRDVSTELYANWTRVVDLLAQLRSRI